MSNEKRKISYTITKYIRNDGSEIEFYTYIKCIRKPKTQNERKNNKNIIESIEDFSIALQIDNKVSRRNRKKGLAHANNDICPDVYGKGKSWKHYSKRKSQWKSISKISL
jgi:hypothetical protein